ncbi:MAG: EAL and HDOD domain-containing protein [Fimbriimonadaceae bacterium]
MQQFLMARQPIYDRQGGVYAYELLYRSAFGSGAGYMDAAASAQALANTLIEIGLDQLAGEKLAFINVSEDLLHSDAIRLLPRDRVVLELLETLKLDASTNCGIEALRAAGYTLAFDDFVFEPSQFAFLKKVSIVKIDVLDTPRAVIRARLNEVKEYGVKLLAEKVEDKEMHRRCMAWGFDYFQGYFYAKPEVLESRGLAPRHQVMLSLLNKLQDPQVSLREIEDLITTDATMAYRLLRLVNSASLGLKSEVSSVRVAVSMIGMAKVQAIASLLTISGQSDDRPELMAIALIRGRMAERIAGMLGYDDPNKHFTAGLFSILDAMLDLSMQGIVDKVPLDAELRDALTNPASKTHVGDTLRRALAYERGDWAAAGDGLAHAELLGQMYADAAAWAQELERAVAAA